MLFDDIVVRGAEATTVGVAAVEVKCAGTYSQCIAQIMVELVQVLWHYVETL